MATKTPEERRKAYFAYVRYVQSIAVLRQSKEKARNAKKEKEAMIQKFIEMVRDTLKQAKEQIWRRACFKKLIAHKDDLENMHGGIEHVAASLEEQNKKVAEAGYVAIKTVKPIDKGKSSFCSLFCSHMLKTLYLQLSALVKQSEKPNKLYRDQAWMKLIPALYRLLQDLKRIEELKKEIAENCHYVEFLKSVQPLLTGDSCDSQHSSDQELENSDTSSSEDITVISR
ncbi:hypothetical protein MRX96_001030 [Rhipicephalus microplus]